MPLAYLAVLALGGALGVGGTLAVSDASSDAARAGAQFSEQTAHALKWLTVAVVVLSVGAWFWRVKQ